MRDDRERLLDMREAIDAITRYSDRGQQAFRDDELIQTWVVHHLQIIGEAARALSPELCADNPSVPWQRIVGMRNILVHHYFGIDRDIVWSVVENELPQLKTQINTLLQEL